MTGIEKSGWISIDRIIPNPANRPDGSGEEDLPGLAATITAYGILEPLIVSAADRRGMFDLQDGERRLKAAVLAGETRVPVVIRRPGESAEEIALVANGQRAGMTATEVATVMARMRDEQGWPPALIASRLGRSPATVAYHLELFDAGPAVMDAVRRGDVPVGSVHAAVRAARRVSRPSRNRRPGPRPGAWFTATHPLAPAAAAACRAAGHPVRSRLGQVACGACFEEAIREDERSAGRQAAAPFTGGDRWVGGSPAVRGPDEAARWDDPGLICGTG